MKKFFYWFVQITWGFLTFILGALFTLILKIFKCPTYRNGYGFITTFGRNWGGLSLGPFAFTSRYNDINYYYNPVYYQQVRRHEFGHSIQVLFLGPLFLLVVGIPSVCRYLYCSHTKKLLSDSWYDSVWFEGTATKWGTKWIDKIENI